MAKVVVKAGGLRRGSSPPLIEGTITANSANTPKTLRRGSSPPLIEGTSGNKFVAQNGFVTAGFFPAPH